QLSAINTYTGPTTVNAGGAMLISGIGSIASSSGVTNNGTFDVSGAWAPVSIQSLTGSGQVNLGGQNLVLSNASGTFSGTMSDGGFYGGAGGSLTLAGGNFTFAGTGTYTGGTVVSGGNFTLSGSLIGSLAILPAGSFTIVPGGILSNSGGTTLNLGQLTNGGTLTSNLFNAGSTSNTGTINGSVMNIGTLVNNGTVNGFTYNAGTLGGSGLMAGSVLNTGVISPGNSIGTLSIASNYVHASSATYLAETNGSGQSDLINVGGQAVLQGGTVFVYAQPGTTYKPTQTYKILNAVGGLSGTFSAVNELYPFLLSSLSYDANNAYLTLQIGGFAAAAVNPIQYAVGTVLDANVSNATGDFAQVLSAMATNIVTDQAAQSVLQQLSGNNYAGLSSSMVQGAQLFMNNFAGQTGGTASLGGSRVAIAEACDVACDPNALPQWGAWGGGIGGFGTIGANAPVGAVTYNAGGFAAGLDRMITRSARLGVTAGYTSGTQWVSGFAGQSKSDTFNVGLYGNYAQDKVYADALVGYAYSGNQMWRPISIPGLQSRTALGQTGANQFYGQLESGYRFDLGTAANAFVTPFARLQAYTGTQNAFTETGAQSLNLTIAQQTTNSLRSVLGAQLGGAMDLGWREKLAMQFRLGWSHEYADVSRPVTATLAGAPAMPFTTFGVSPQRDGVVLGLSASTAIADATSIYLRYEGNIAGQDSAQAITAGVRMTW
ncbi:MAG: autotransporter domain-containing protein, partial [Reyranella sp.]|nr:autotransporter domain-containing protein [Reyranella sp.]